MSDLIHKFARQIPSRKGFSAYRANLTTDDKLLTPGALSGADVATGGSLLANTAYNFSYSVWNTYGNSASAASAAVTTANDASNTHVIRLTIPQFTDSSGVVVTSYDIFLSTDSSPKWVAKVTEAQRAAGVTITAVGTVNATSPGAGKVDIRVVGTGGTPWAIASGINDPSGFTVIDCAGYSKILAVGQLTFDDWRAGINGSYNITMRCFGKNAITNNWFALENPLSFGFGYGTIMSGAVNADIDGIDDLIVLCTAFGGGGVTAPTNPKFSMWYDLTNQ